MIWKNTLGKYEVKRNLNKRKDMVIEKQEGYINIKINHTFFF